MPRSKRSANYAPELKELLEHALKSDVPIEIPCETEKHANRLRNQLYAYINALDHEDISEGVPLHSLRSTIYRRIQISSNKELLVLINRSSTEEIKTISKYLAGTSARVQRDAPTPATEKPAPPFKDTDVVADVIADLYGRKDDA